MSYALVIDNAIHSEGGLPDAARRLDDGAWVLGLRTYADPQRLAACGYLAVVDTDRPADTAAGTFDRTLRLVEGVPTVAWVPRPKTAGELAGDRQVANEADLGTKLRARLDAAKVDIAALVGDPTATPPVVGTIDQANAEIAAAQAARDAAQSVIENPASTNAQKNAARQDKRDAQQDLAIARLTKQHARDSLALNRAVVALARLVLRADLLDDNAGT